MVGQVLAAAGAASAMINIVVLLALSAQVARPTMLVELERQVGIAKGDVGAARRLRTIDSENADDEGRSFDERLAATRRR